MSQNIPTRARARIAVRSLSGVDAVGGGWEGHEVDVGIGLAGGAHGTADDEEYIRNIAMRDFTDELKICGIAGQDIDSQSPVGADLAGAREWLIHTHTYSQKASKRKPRKTFHLWNEMSVCSTTCSATWRRLMVAVQKRNQCVRADECRWRIERLHAVFG
jgi:hypothetical protein